MAGPQAPRRRTSGAAAVTAPCRSRVSAARLASSHLASRSRRSTSRRGSCALSSESCVSGLALGFFVGSRGPRLRDDGRARGGWVPPGRAPIVHTRDESPQWRGQWHDARRGESECECTAR